MEDNWLVKNWNIIIDINGSVQRSHAMLVLFCYWNS